MSIDAGQARLERPSTVQDTAALIPWTTDRETRRESNPSGGFADRLSPGESRAALSAGVEPAACGSGVRRAIRCTTRA